MYEMENNERLFASIRSLLIEIATELDLHYDDEDFRALHPTFERIAPSIRLLHESGTSIPEEVEHILKRYRQSQQ
jgi:hypothetical protein